MKWEKSINSFSCMHVWIGWCSTHWLKTWRVEPVFDYRGKIQAWASRASLSRHCVLRIPPLFLWSTVRFASRQSWCLTLGLQSGDKTGEHGGHGSVLSTMATRGTSKVTGNIPCPNYPVLLKCEPQAMRPGYHAAAAHLIELKSKAIENLLKEPWDITWLPNFCSYSHVFCPLPLFWTVSSILCQQSSC